MKNWTSVTSVRSFAQSVMTMTDEALIEEVVNLGKTGTVISVHVRDKLSDILVSASTVGRSISLLLALTYLSLVLTIMYRVRTIPRKQSNIQ